MIAELVIDDCWLRFAIDDCWLRFAIDDFWLRFAIVDCCWAPKLGSRQSAVAIANPQSAIGNRQSAIRNHNRQSAITIANPQSQSQICNHKIANLQSPIRNR
jgi:hypothetical protein